MKDERRTQIEERYGKPIRDVLHELYVVQRKGNRIISKELGIGSTTVLAWLRAYDIPVRLACSSVAPTLFCHRCEKPLTSAQHRSHRHNPENGLYCSHTCWAATQQKQFPMNEVIALYQNGMTVKDIAQRYGTNRDTLSRRLKEAGVSVRRRTNPYWKGKQLPEQTKAKIRDATLRQFADPVNRLRAAERTAQQIAEGRTGKAFNRLEQAVANILDELGCKYIWQYRQGKVVFDFYLPDYATVIEAHGTFWHADPRFYSHSQLHKIQQRNITNDAYKHRVASNNNLTLMIIWEHDIKNNFQVVTKWLAEHFS